MTTSEILGVGPTQFTEPTKRLLSVPEVEVKTGLGRTTVYGLMTNGDLRSVKIGRRRLVRSEDLDAFLAGLSGN